MGSDHLLGTQGYKSFPCVAFVPAYLQFVLKCHNKRSTCPNLCIGHLYMGLGAATAEVFVCLLSLAS